MMERIANYIARTILQMRFVSGKISYETYEEKLKLLEDSE